MSYPSSEVSISIFTQDTVESDSTCPTDDELNIMARSSPSVSSSKQSLRTRHSLGTTVTIPGKRKRVRSLSTSNLNDDIRKEVAKKLKMDGKKAITLTLNLKKVSIEAARRRWLYLHRHLFKPLLPSSTSFFSHLQKEVETSDDTKIFVTPKEIMEQPKLVKGGTMKDYQLEGLSYLTWMYNNGMNCILGDEMGLGKTLQTLAVFAHIKETTKSQDPHLIICPLSVLSSWLTEASRWIPSFRTIRFHGPSPERKRLKEYIHHQPFDICVTTYETYVAEDKWFKSRRWTYCVLDEGHKIKNSETNIAHKLQGIGSLFRLVLTGTPVQNNLLELWGLLHWLYPNVFTSASEDLFKDSFNLERGMYRLPFISATQALLSVVMLRRTKAIVEMEVPPKETSTIFLPLTELQRFWTYRLLTRMDTMDMKQIFSAEINPDDQNANQGRKELLSHVETQMQKVNTGNREGNQWKRLMNLLIQLRQVCDHPYLLPDAEPSPFVNGEHVVAGSSKLIAIDKLLAHILPKGERVLIFSQWTGMLDLLEDFMTLRSIPYARLDGGTRRPRRALDIKLFQQEKSPYQVYLISTKAGGLGINLTKASTVIMCDSDWNPQNDLQAIARAHRIGQTKVVKVYQLICRGSVEDQMLDRIRRKLFLSIKVMGSPDNPSTSEGSTLRSSELLDILRRGSSALSNVDDGMSLARFLDANIEDILKDSQTRENIREVKIKHELDDGLEDEDDVKPDRQLLVNAEEEEKKLLQGVAQVQCRLFEGKVVSPPKHNKEIAKEWQELQNRARVDRIVVVDGAPFIVAHKGIETATADIKTISKRKADAFEWEDWCIYCRDGGNLFLCSRCPRVFHASCHGISKPRGNVSCSQHICSICYRTTSESGGMLFRCQTCPDAFCEDCMPDGEIDAIGEVLPEFALLGFGAKGTAYYIRCQGCRQRFIEDPKLWEEWQEEMRETQAKLQSLESFCR